MFFRQIHGLGGFPNAAIEGRLGFSLCRASSGQRYKIGMELA
jgi:hypothetical protein